MYSKALEMLKDRQFSTNVTSVLRRMKPLRQVQCVELMVDCNKFTSDYANALLTLTPPGMLVDSAHPRKQTGFALRRRTCPSPCLRLCENLARRLAPTK